MSEQQQFVPIGGDVPHFGLLREKPVDQWSRLQHYLTASWKHEDQRACLIRISGCLDKLASSLLQVHRMRVHHDELIDRSKGMGATPASYTAYRGDISCADFEGLLLQGRSAF
jgi:hypothetical protein